MISSILDQDQEMVDFLEDLGISQYKDKFKRAKVNDLESLKELSKNDFQKIGIPPGFIIKIFRKIDQIKKEKQIEQDKQIKQQQKQSQQKQQQQQKKQSQQKKDGGVQMDEQKPGCLLDGEYDEQESHNYFLEALMEFRNSKPKQNDEVKTEEIVEQPKTQVKSILKKKNSVVGGSKQVEFQTDKIRDNYFSNKDDFEYKSQNMFFMPTFKSEDMELEESEIQKCNNCRKQFRSQNSQMFCNIACEQNYENFNKTNCNNKFCRRSLKKDSCLYILGQHFCNNYCFQNHNLSEDEYNQNMNNDAIYLQEVHQKYLEQKQNEEIKEEEEQSIGEIDIMGDIEEMVQPKVVGSVSGLEEKYRKLNEKLKID